jgi:hypothetical protein
VSYRVRDLLMFSARTYNRLFENYNRDVWPLHLLAVALGIAILVFAWRRQHPRVIGALLAIAWLWVAYAFHWQRFSTIHTYARWFALAFVVEGGLLLVPRSLGSSVARGFFPRDRGTEEPLKLLLFALILFIYPLLSQRHELFAIAPDPTALATIALGSRSRWFLLPIPILWCAFSATTHLAMAAR